jgi:peptidoglycan-associated lipoprotein
MAHSWPISSDQQILEAVMPETRIVEDLPPHSSGVVFMGRSLARLGFAAVVVAGLVGCKSAVKLDEPAPVESRAATGASATDAANASANANANAASRMGSASLGSLDGRGPNSGGAGGSASANAASATLDPLKDPSSPLAKRSIYFEYDSYVVRDEYRPVIDAHARYLVAERNRRVIVQGNTDERGSREFNLALGQKRAEAVRRSLTALGVHEAQVEAISLGEEKPRATGQDEASFAENRRDDLVYP